MGKLARKYENVIAPALESDAIIKQRLGSFELSKISPYKVEADGTADLINRTYALMKQRGIDIRRLRLAAICTVCVKPFLKEVRLMEDLLAGIGFIKDELAAHATPVAA